MGAARYTVGTIHTESTNVQVRKMSGYFHRYIRTTSLHVMRLEASP